MNQINNLSAHSSRELSLLSSRRRLHCQPSVAGSETEEQSEEALKEFEREIEQRFKVSIPNKIYTFPRRISSYRDLVSSDEEQDSLNMGQDYFEPMRNFKKKHMQKATQGRDLLNDSYKETSHRNNCNEELKDRCKGTHNKSHLKDKNKSHLKDNNKSHLKDNKKDNNKNNEKSSNQHRQKDGSKNKRERDSNNSLVDVDRKSHKKQISEFNCSKTKERQKQNSKGRENKAGERLKTEPESSNSFMQTMRSRLAKRH